MSETNICSEALGAQIIDYSSTSDKQKCQPHNILNSHYQNIWNSGQGLPQFVTISLEKVQYQYSQIDAIGFYCWHDYGTNPKTIQIQVAHNKEDQFVLWAELQLQMSNLRQMFRIRPIPPSYKVVKINITETHGDYQTYLNQVFLMASPAESNHHSQMSMNELQSQDKNAHLLGPFTKTQKHFKPSKTKKDALRKMQTQEAKNESQNYLQSDFHHRQMYSTSQSKPQIQIQRQPSYEDSPYNQKDQSFNNNVALLALSKKAVEMEEDMDDVKRQLQVLDLKVNLTFQNIQKHMVNNIEKIVDSKLKQFKEEMKKEFRGSRERPELREVKSQHDKRELASRQVYEEVSEYQLTKGKISRQNPKSLHLNNLNPNGKSRQVEKNNLSNLMNQLNEKLKQRQKKVKRMQSKEKQEQRSKRHKLSDRY